MSLAITKITQKIEHLAAESKLVYWFAAKYYHDVIKREIKLANITADDHVLFIGGGVCPLSAILLHQNTGAKVTVIDNNQSCVSKAQDQINRLGISDSVSVLFADGIDANLSFAKYSVVHFAMQVSPMERVFAQVEKKVALGTKLLVRKPKKKLSMFYSKLSSRADCKHILHNGVSNIGSTLLYIKEECKHEEKVSVYSANSAAAFCAVKA